MAAAAGIVVPAGRSEPVVIHEELLRTAVNDQIEAEVAEVALEEGVAFGTVKSLRLDYRNILKIANLQFFTQLTRLQLDNNIIERIENLDSLVNLTWLDLSFNNITALEGLGRLTKLTDLTLFNNRISKIENLDELVNLEVFSIGNNAVAKLDNIVYLTRFPRLKVFNAAGNPVCQHASYRTYALAYLRGLCYLDYRIVDKSEVKEAKNAMINEQIVLEEEERAAAAKLQEQQRADEQDRVNSRAHVKGFDTMFQSMFAMDRDYQHVLPLTQGVSNEHMATFEAQWQVVHRQFYQLALERAADKNGEVAQLRAALSHAKAQANQIARQKYHEFEHEKKQDLQRLARLVDLGSIAACVQGVRRKLAALVELLLAQELQLVEGVEDVLRDFERNYTELCNSITEQSSATFARLRQLENEFHEQHTELVLNAFERHSKGDFEEMTDEVLELISDKEIVSNALMSSHDFRIGRIDAQEDALATGMAADLDTTISSLMAEEIQRNRNRINEILVFRDRITLEIDQAEENVK